MKKKNTTFPEKQSLFWRPLYATYKNIYLAQLLEVDFRSLSHLRQSFKASLEVLKDAFSLDAT